MASSPPSAAEAKAHLELDEARLCSPQPSASLYADLRRSPASAKTPGVSEMRSPGARHWGGGDCAPGSASSNTPASRQAVGVLPGSVPALPFSYTAGAAAPSARSPLRNGVPPAPPVPIGSAGACDPRSASASPSRAAVGPGGAAPLHRQQPYTQLPFSPPPPSPAGAQRAPHGEQPARPRVLSYAEAQPQSPQRRPQPQPQLQPSPPFPQQPQPPRAHAPPPGSAQQPNPRAHLLDSRAPSFSGAMLLGKLVQQPQPPTQPQSQPPSPPPPGHHAQRAQVQAQRGPGRAGRAEAGAGWQWGDGAGGEAEAPEERATPAPAAWGAAAGAGADGRRTLTRTLTPEPPLRTGLDLGGATPHASPAASYDADPLRTRVHAAGARAGIAPPAVYKRAEGSLDRERAAAMAPTSAQLRGPLFLPPSRATAEAARKAAIAESLEHSLADVARQAADGRAAQLARAAAAEEEQAAGLGYGWQPRHPRGAGFGAGGRAAVAAEVAAARAEASLDARIRNAVRRRQGIALA